MSRRLTDPRNYVPKGWHRMENGKLMRNVDHVGDLPGENELLNRYRAIQTNSGLYTEGGKIKQYAPKLTVKDYEIGVIKRYFIQKSNDKNAPIFEISRNRTGKYRENPLYNLAEIDWVISGEGSEKIIGNSIKKISVNEMNSLSISQVSDIIPNLKLFLPNLLQYYKDSKSAGQIKLGKSFGSKRTSGKKGGY